MQKVGKVTISSTNGTWGNSYHWEPEPGHTVRQLRAMQNDGLVKLVQTQPENAYHTAVYDVVKV